MNRNDQFRQWAKAAYRKMYDLYGYIDTDSESAYVDVLARAAYDLVSHILESPALNGKVVPGYGLLLDIATAPDLPVLPEEKAE